MSLQERVFGLETEYAVNFYPAQHARMPGQRLLVQTLQEVLCREYGLPDSEYVVSGGKFHYDVGHAEWASPECLTAREATLYDKAADHVLAQIVPQAQHLLAIKGYEGKLLVVKNNVDSVGNTYGCHENYLMLRSTDLLIYEHFLRYIMQSLIPFLVTRLIFAGAGRLVSTDAQKSPAHFEISQRAAFIDTAVSFSTTRERPILNLGRENEALASGNRRRLHLILGDANLSGWATWLKLGTTGIMLRMAEDLFLSDTPLLQDPVAALHTVSRDLSIRQPLALRQQGKTMSALDIQWQYYALADSYLEQFGASHEELQIMEAWEQALTDLEQDSMRLRDRADWVIKKHMLDSYLTQQGASWDRLDPTMLEALRTQDLLYHNLSAEGLFTRFFQPDTLITQAEIAQAQHDPPQYTRARIRGEAIKQARLYKQRVTVERWQDIVIDGQKISLPDPLTFDCAQLDFDENWWAKSIMHADRAIVLRALKRLAWQPQAGALTLLMQHAQHNSDAQARKTAVEALGYRADKQAHNVLLACLNDSDSQVRWAAEEAMEKVMRGVPTPDPNAILHAEKEKPLISIIS